MPLTPEEIRPRLRGVISFPITPFDDDLRLKESAFQTHVDYLVRSGMHSIVAAGGTGELYSMTTDEIRRVYRLAVEAAGGRVPVIAGVGYNLAVATDLARDVQAARADAILVLPHYYGRAEDDGMFSGREGGRVRPPLAELTAEDRQALRAALSAMGYSVVG